jgi:type IV pilus assembly protein PilC
MPSFRYSAAAEDGTVVSGIENAESAVLAREALVARNLQPISVAPKKSLLQLEITKKKVNKRQLMYLCRQLAVFLRAGIPVLHALTSLAGETNDKLMKSALLRMADELEGGSRFSEAAANSPELFPSFAIEVLRSAELTGNLDQVLDQLADYLERDIETRHKVTSAMMYPAIVLVLAVIVSVVLVVFVLPKFKSFFASLHAKLPLPTRMLLGFANLIGRWGLYIGVAVGIFAALAVVSLRTQRGRDARDDLALRIPVIGKLLRTAILERFCRLLCSMTAAGVPLPEAIAVTTGATNNAVFRRGLTEARGAMLQGDGLAGPLVATNLFPGAAGQMFRVGEDTGTLEEQLHAAAEYLDRDLDYKLKRFTTLIEPAVILAVGVVVGFVAIALVSAMYGVFHQVKV